IKEFKKKVVAYGKEVDSFKKKEIMTLDEMRNNVEKLSELTKNLNAAMDEADVGNLLVQLDTNYSVNVLFPVEHVLKLILIGRCFRNKPSQLVFGPCGFS
ncbi:hypothetical protein chiPu_0024927, partial [Chiloscyllium punctatum]|nr:hypothetical protein [Chiloscyllium punctatum]